MNVNVQLIPGPWDLGFVLDKQTLSSKFKGHSENGRAQFDTVRTEIGEAVFQLKYRDDYLKIVPLAAEVIKHLGSKFNPLDCVIPMPASKVRTRQPVYEIAKEVAAGLGKPFRTDILIKNGTTVQMKDLKTKEEKLNALLGCFSCNDVLPDKLHNILLIDDLYDTGSSLEVACKVLRNYKKIGKIYVAVLSRTK